MTEKRFGLNDSGKHDDDEWMDPQEATRRHEPAATDASGSLDWDEDDEATAAWNQRHRAPRASALSPRLSSQRDVIAQRFRQRDAVYASARPEAEPEPELEETDDPEPELEPPLPLPAAELAWDERPAVAARHPLAERPQHAVHPTESFTAIAARFVVRNEPALAGRQPYPSFDFENAAPPAPLASRAAPARMDTRQMRRVAAPSQQPKRAPTAGAADSRWGMLNDAAPAAPLIRRGPQPSHGEPQPRTVRSAPTQSARPGAAPTRTRQPTAAAPVQPVQRAAPAPSRARPTQPSGGVKPPRSELIQTRPLRAAQSNPAAGAPARPQTLAARPERAIPQPAQRPHPAQPQRTAAPVRQARPAEAPVPQRVHAPQVTHGHDAFQRQQQLAEVEHAHVQEPPVQPRASALTREQAEYFAHTARHEQSFQYPAQAPSDPRSRQPESGRQDTQPLRFTALAPTQPTAEPRTQYPQSEQFAPPQAPPRLSPEPRGRTLHYSQHSQPEQFSEPASAVEQPAPLPARTGRRTTQQFPVPAEARTHTAQPIQPAAPRQPAEPRPHVQLRHPTQPLPVALFEPTSPEGAEIEDLERDESRTDLSSWAPPQARVPRLEQSPAQARVAPQTVQQARPQRVLPHAPASFDDADLDSTLFRKSAGGDLARQLKRGAIPAVGVIAALLIGWFFLAGSDTADLTIQTQPSDASVSVDGRPLPGSSSPFQVQELPAGEHQVLIQKAGFRDRLERVSLRAGEARQLATVVLEPVPPPVAAPAPIVEQIPVAPEPRELTRAEMYAAKRAERAQKRSERLEQYAAEKAEKRAERLARRGSSSSSSDSDDEPTSSRSSRRAAPEPAALDEVEAKPSRHKKSDAAGDSAERAPLKAAGGEPGMLRLNSRPWAEVRVDGKRVGTTPQMGLRLSSGQHTVELINPELGMKKTLSVTIEPGQLTTKVVTLE